MSATIMQLFGDALGNKTPHDGQYLKTMDFEATGGLGKMTTTPDAADAMIFPTFLDATMFWKASPKCRPLRSSDGRPNRPLTAYNWQFSPAEVAE